MRIATAKAIEMSVTNGLGYDSRSDFDKTCSFYSSGIDSEDVKNTSEGLRAHLRKLTAPEYKKHGNIAGFMFGQHGDLKHIRTISRWGYASLKRKNQNAIDRAYDVEAKGRGRVKTIVQGAMNDIFGVNFEKVAKYLDIMGAKDFSDLNKA